MSQIARLTAHTWITHARQYLKRTVRWPLVLCIGLAIVFSQGPMLFGLMYGYADPSYNYAYGKAAADHLSFGDQFISTYGPLGYLVSNYVPAHLHHVMAWYWVYLILLGVGVYWFCSLYIKRPGKRLLAMLLLIYALSATKGGGFMEWSYLLTFVLYGFIYLALPKARKRTILLAGMAIIAAWFSLMKFTLGLGALLSLLGLSVFGNASNKERVKQLGLGLGVYLVAFVGLAAFFDIRDLVAYVHSTMLISGEFSSAMAQFDPETVMATWLVGTALLGVLLWPLWREKARALRYAFLIPLVFEVWKYCVARQDSRLAICIQVLLPLTLMVYLSLRVRINRDAWIAAIILVLTVMSIWANKISFHNDFMSIVGAPLTNLRDHRFVTLIGRGNLEKRWEATSAAGLQGAALPQAMRDAIGKQGVDIFPWETAIIAANDLKWQNSPSPFSFQNFSPYLDQKNADFYASKQAPPFVIWHHVGESGVHGVDFRHIMWDEPLTTQALLANYELVQDNESFMLLQKREHPLAVKTTTKTMQAKGEDQWMPVSQPEDAALFVSVDAEPGLMGKLGTFLIRDKKYIITVKDSMGKESSYRFVRENQRQLLLGWLPKDWNELVMFVRDHRLPDKTMEFKINTPLNGPVTTTNVRWIDNPAATSHD